MRELFRQPNFNFLQWRAYSFALSLLLIAAGAASVWWHGGLRLGIDFKGGTMVYLKFAESPDLERIRSALAARGLGANIIQRIGPPEQNEIIIGTQQAAGEEEALDAARRAILGALRDTYELPSGSVDLNNLGTDTLTETLLGLDPIGLSERPGEARRRYREIAERITDYRDTERGGLIRSFEELRALEGVPPAVVNALAQRAFLSPFVVRNVEVVGPQVGQQLRRQALLATGLALGGVLIYIGVRFRQWVYGSAAIIAGLHDLLITVAFLSLFNYEFDLTIVAGLLTLVGYSVNDTIVTFDRIRENARLLRREKYADLVNRSVNQTLSRTILTSGLTLLAVLALFFLGGEVLHGFAFTLLVGILAGTYSTIFIASPIVVKWRERSQARTPAGRKGR